MSLKEEFESDLTDTFFVPEEFGCTREFKFIEDGMEKVITTPCVWDTEALKQRLVVQQQGVFMGSVLCFIYKSLFKVEPKPEQIIYTRIVDEVLGPLGVYEGWRVIDVTDAEKCFELYLDKLLA